MSALRTGRLLPQGYSLLVAESNPRSVEEPSDLIGHRAHDLPACSIAPQPTVCPQDPMMAVNMVLNFMLLVCA
jgi:hypothetical protein